MADTTQQAPTPLVYKEWQDAWEFFNERLFKGELPPCLITLHRHPRSRGYFAADRFVNRDGETTDEIAMNPEYFAAQSPKSVLSTLCHEMAHSWQTHCGQEKSRHTYHNTEWADKMTAIGLEPSSTGMPDGKRTGEKVTHYIIKGGPFDVFCDELLATGDFVSWFDRHSAVDGELNHYVHTGGPVEPGAQQCTEPAAVASEGETHAASAQQPDEAPAATATAPAISTPAPAAAPVGKPLGAQVAAKLSTPTARKAANGGVNKSNRAKYVCPDCTAAAWGKPGLHLICGTCSQDMPATTD